MLSSVPLIPALGALLVVIALAPPLAERLKLPTAVVLAGLGLAIGFVLEAYGTRSVVGMPSTVADDLLIGFPSEAYLSIFLPVLLFDAALGLNVRRLVDEWATVLVLAVVAVIVSLLLVGAATHIVSGRDLLVCLLLGAIVSTTDPAAVVQLFRGLGASERLRVLVEGESLLNDAAAIAVFAALAAAVGADTVPEPSAPALAVAVGLAGGAVVGMALAAAALAALSLVRDHVAAEITLTVALAYLAYFLADRALGVSGVVAVVAAGLVLRAEGRARIQPDGWDSLIALWGQLGFWANSLIFLLVSMLMPRLLGSLTWHEAGLILVVFAAALGARAIVLYGLLPGLAAAGIAQTVRAGTKLVMLWGGVRGGVTLVLVLAVSEDLAIPPDHRQFVAVVGAGYVFLTLAINATTLRQVARLVGLDRLSPTDAAVRDRAVTLALGEVRDWTESLARHQSIDRRLLAAAEAHLPADEIATPADCPPPDDPAEATRAALMALAAAEQNALTERFRGRAIGQRLLRSALADAGRRLDAANSGGAAGYEAAAMAETAFGWRLRAALFLQRHLGVGGLLKRYLGQRFERLLLARAVLHDLATQTDTRIAALFGPAAHEAAARLVELRRERVEKALAALRLQYPAYADRLEARFLARAALRREAAAYGSLLAGSAISPEIHADLARDLRRRRQRLEAPLEMDLGLDRDALVSRLPLFSSLPPDAQAGVARLLTPRLYLPGDIVVRGGDRGDVMYFISSGAVEVGGLDPPVRLGSGDFFGELALLRPGRRRTADVTSLAYCRLLELSRADLDRLLEADPALRRHIEETAAYRLGLAVGDDAPELQTIRRVRE